MREIEDREVLLDRRQRTMEMAVMAVVSQGGVSLDKLGGPSYRNEHGMACHIGVFIDVPEDESTTYARGLKHSTLGALTELGMSFLSDLQFVHDGSESPEDRCLQRRYPARFWDAYTRRLMDLCDRYDLRFPGELL